MFWLSFAQAWTFLTILPIPSRFFSNADRQTSWALSIYFYPLIGLLHALILILVNSAMPASWNSLIQAALVLTPWVILTGALHLDGLADSVDGLYAMHKNPARLQPVLKDPNCGPIGVVAIVLILLLKLVLLAGLIEMNVLSSALIAAMMGARWSVLVLMLTTDYVGQSHDHPRPYGGLGLWFYAISIVLILVLVILFNGLFLLLLGISVALSIFLWRKLWMRLVNGYVGDSLGALIEGVEVLLLLCVYGYYSV